MMYDVVLLAAGKGKRMGANQNKMLLLLQGSPILIHSLHLFEQDPACKGIILVIHPDEQMIMEELLRQHKVKKIKAIVHGGNERQDSVYNGLQAVTEDIVLIHDGARPFVTGEIVSTLVNVSRQTGAAIPAVPVKDTIKKVLHHQVQQTIERSSLWSVQTPQAFRVSVIQTAHEKAREYGWMGTDDASLLEYLDVQVDIVESDYDNIKITTPEDLYFAEAILKKRESLS
ncbi:2-C-methyl-D-erythritol 4-phosphate cytidylyltransferase [Bacillus coahuilensis m2-6]|uniref:2-C-methyl-D-erythritol 4-phosphate cytidylyltransferase n=1 Tax=Bacillus coahuilensis TaxID=408580 RepID=UPI0001850B2D|nr:2-C-methyl-D-erythritol 4-phosphate cytidylyltransferase [Bacillus coahuilensis]KUP04600.1 2-C-methyl-D-erythritol 4-phosphate cytidylyltransferase [Bacillus coahuilensis m2-6]